MEKDTAPKRCLSDDERYADLINGLLFNGEPIVHPDNLQELDTQSLLQSSFFKREKKYRQLYRDLVKKVVFGVNFVVIGVENQQEVHYLMPLRAMAYDTAQYQKQAAKVRKKVRSSKFATGKFATDKSVTSAEFLSGFRKSDRLFPCITIILYYGEHWDGARSLHELLDFSDIPEELKQYINNYTVHVFEIMHMENTSVFRSDLKQIFDFIRHSKDKKKLKELLETDAAFQSMDEDACDMIAAYADTKELVNVKKTFRKDGKVNMCKALEDMCEDARQEGIQEGKLEGIEEGKTELLSTIICKKIEKNQTLDMIAEDLVLDIEVIRPIYEELKKKSKTK